MKSGNSLQEAVRAYFGQPGFRRFLATLRIKYEASSSGPRGYVTLQGQTAVEREALDGFYGIYTPGHHQISVRYSIAKFERLLLASRFGISISQLFQLLDGESLLTRGEQRIAANEAWETLIREALAIVPALTQSREEETDSNPDEYIRLVSQHTERIAAWVESLRDETSPGSRTLRKLFGARPTDARACLADCIRVLLELSEAHARTGDHPDLLPIRLPVISAQVTGDAHALDWKNPLGRLFWWGLADCFHKRQEEYPPLSEAQAAMEEESEWAVDVEDVQAEGNGRNVSQALLIREGYRNGGIADDDLSSQVIFFAPGRYSRWEERVLTLRQVERMAPEEVKVLQCSAVYAVENPSVFAILVDAAAREYEKRLTSEPLSLSANLPLLVCANGQPSVAVIKLLELLLGQQTENSPPLFYSGDIDGKGLDIALSLYQRFPRCCQPWKMDREQYARYAHHGLPLTLAERERFRTAHFPWDPQLGSSVVETGIKLHQELWVDDLKMDWLKEFMLIPGTTSGSCQTLD